MADKKADRVKHNIQTLFDVPVDYNEEILVKGMTEGGELEYAPVFAYFDGHNGCVNVSVDKGIGKNKDIDCVYFYTGASNMEGEHLFTMSLKNFRKLATFIDVETDLSHF